MGMKLDKRKVMAYYDGSSFGLTLKSKVARQEKPLVKGAWFDVALIVSQPILMSILVGIFRPGRS